MVMRREGETVNMMVREASFARFHDMPPVLRAADGAEHWVTRGANFVIVISRVQPGTVLARASQPDEYMVLLPEGLGAELAAPDGRVTSTGDSLTIVPPGDSSVVCAGAGYVYRVFSNLATDLLTLADNADAYAAGAPDVAPLVAWPAPPDGWRLRHYALADYIRAPDISRVFRSTNLMLNIFVRQTKPRNTSAMSPHFHDDFEQASISLAGTYVHHMRYPWGADLGEWRADDHGQVGSPAVVVIPPKVIHTTQSLGPDPTRLVDVFAPPRVDFSIKPGMVCNAIEYPLPPALLA